MAKKKVFLSSPKYGMTSYRANIAEMIARSDPFELIAMEHFGARSEAPPDHYRKGIEQCDIFVGLVGPRFGGSPRGEERSHSEIEYDTAKELGKPQLMFMVAGEEEEGAPKETPEQSLRQLKFRSRVLGEKQADFPASPQAAATNVLSALLNELHSSMTAVVETTTNQIEAAKPANTDHPHTWLLFPFVSNTGGFDTGISVVNTSARPYLTMEDIELGAFTVHYYGMMGTSRYVASHPGPHLMGGEHAVYSLSTGGMVQATPGFQGYLIVHCHFRAAGFAYIGQNVKDGEKDELKNGSCYLATEVTGPPGVAETLIRPNARRGLKTG